MNAFESAVSVERRGMERLRPWLEMYSENSAIVYTAKGSLARLIQETCGDVLINPKGRPGVMHAIECKFEEENRFGNLFIETWSNRNLEDRESHPMRGSNPGWAIKQRADTLLYYFLADDALFIIPLFELKRWAFGYGSVGGAIYQYPEKLQAKRTQANDTWGRCVPIADLRAAIPAIRRHSVRQLSMLDGVAV